MEENLEMEEKLQLAIAKVREIMGYNPTYLFVLADPKDLGITSLCGNPERIAEILFYVIHQGIEPLSSNVYHILKSIVMGCIKNKTGLGMDLMRAATLEIQKQKQDEQSV